MKVLSAESNLASATNLNNSTVVRVYNSDSSSGTITKKDAAGNTLGTITVPSGEVVYCEKQYTDTLEGGATLKASQIAYSNMMYYASSSSGGGGGGGIVTTNLILNLDAGDNSSYGGSGVTWTDLSGNGYNATLTNGPTYNSSNDGSIVFDGADDFVNLGTQINSDIQLTDITISFWAYIDSTAADEIFVSMESLAVNAPFVIYHDLSSTYNVQNTGAGDVGGGNTKTIDVIVTDSSSEKRFTTSNNALNATTWYNIAVVLDVTNNAFYTYINGVEEAKWVSNNTSGGIKSTTNNFRIGGASPYLDGRIAQFLAYDKALTASEVLQNYNAIKSRYGY
tara:strand:+ start:751 stop:1761 length:1011 start_codon:yes stop_codon:yes gene_type:complete